MSLIDATTEAFVMIDKRSVPDGRGGIVKEWVDGATINGSIVKDSSMQARIAQAQGVTSVYTLTTKKNIMLDYHDVLRRVDDGTIFRVTSKGKDKNTPMTAGLDMRQVTCEEWVLPATPTEEEDG